MALDDLITRVGDRLDTLEPKLSSPDALRELLTRLDEKIRTAQEKGYSPKEIVDLVIECGFEVKRADFEKQLTKIFGAKRKKATPRTAGKRTATTAQQ